MQCKRMLSLLLTAVIVLGMVFVWGGGIVGAEPAKKQSVPKSSLVLDDELLFDAEYVRAVKYGFLSDDLSQADPDNTVVTWAQYCDMLGRMIRMNDEAAYSVWKERTKNAPDTEIKRDGAMVSLLFAAKEIGYAFFNQKAPAGFEDYAPKVWEVVTMDYPVFDWDKPVVLSSDCADNNHVGPAYDFCLRRVSGKTGKSLLEFDENKDLRLEQPLSLREAVLSAVRLHESGTARIIVSAEEAKDSTVSEETIDDGAKMALVSGTSIPDWHGTSLDYRNMFTRYGRYLVAEEDIAEFADMGFNYLRLMLVWTDFCKEENGTLKFYSDVLENIDRILEWCVQYDIHLCIDMHELPGYGFEVRIVEEDAASRENSILVWDVFSARYANVPANALSYNLVNEPDASYFQDGSYAVFADEMVQTIRNNDKAKKLLVSDGIGDLSYEYSWSSAASLSPVKGLDSTVMQTMHIYPWHTGAKSGYISLFDWPYEYAAPVNNYVSEQPLTLRGDFPAGTRVTFYLDTVYEDSEPIVCRADGNIVDSYDREFKLGQNNCVFIGDGRAEFDFGKNNGLTLEFTVSENCSEITIGNNLCVTDLLVRIPSDTEKTYPVPANEKDNGFIYETGKYDTVYIRTTAAWSELSSTINIAGDFSYTVDNPAQADVFDMESLRTHVEKWVDWSKKTGTPIMCNEFNIPVSLPEEIRVGYMRAILDLFEKYDIPWCIYTNNLRCWTPVVTVDDVLAGDTILPVDGSVTQKGDVWYDEPVLELLREYMD